MNDPHVVTLIYACETTSALRLDDVAHFEVSLPRSEATAKYSKRTLVVRLAAHFAAADDAVKSVQEDLDGWELSIRIRFRNPGFRFVFHDAEIVDRNPPPKPPGQGGAGHGEGWIRQGRGVGRRRGS